MAKSSIHIEAGHAGYLAHNDRSEKTVNSIFPNNKNEIWNEKAKAFSIYRKELSKRTKAYTKRTKQKLQSKSITHLSAIVNLNSNHTMSDLKKIKLLLEKKLDTKVFQIAIHRDEGHIDDDKKEVVNYHAHIEFMGLDSDGASVRKKLTRMFLSNLQSDVAISLNMERGKNYTKAKEPRPRRLDTYDFKEHKRREQEQRQKIAVEHKEELAAKEKKHLVTLKEVNAENTRLRKELQDNQGTREEYKKLEAIIKELRAKAKAKALEHGELITSLHELAYTKVPDYDIELKKAVLVEVPYKELYEDKINDYDEFRFDSYLDLEKAEAELAEVELKLEEVEAMAYSEEIIYEEIKNSNESIELEKISYKKLYEDESKLLKTQINNNQLLMDKIEITRGDYEYTIEQYGNAMYIERNNNETLTEEYENAIEQYKNKLEVSKKEAITNDNLHQNTKLALARFEVLVEKLQAKGIDIYKLAEDKPMPKPKPKPFGGMSP